MFVLYGCGVCCIVTDACATDVCGNGTFPSGVNVCGV